ncbi:MAG TPA: PAS domain S-box protein [Syntrophorhabdaceae bacterium]
MTHRFYKSIKAHLLFLVLICLLPALGIILYSGIERRKDAMRDAELSILAVANSLASEHLRIVESTRQILATLSKLPDVQGLRSDPCNQLFEDIRAQNPVYGNLFLTDLHGDIIASSLRSTVSNVRDRKYFRDAMMKKDFSVGGYTIGRITGTPLIHFAYPVLDRRGRLKAILAAGIDLNRYGQKFLNEKLPEGAALALTDYEGVRLFRYPFPEKFIGQSDRPEVMNIMMGGPEEGTFSYQRDGRKALYAYTRFRLAEGETPYLYIRVSLPEKQALAHARRLLLIDLILLGIAFSIALVFALVIGKAVIVRRLDKLVDASLRLRKGDLRARTGLPHEEDELGRLAAAFDAMAVALELKEQGRLEAQEALSSQFRFLQNLLDTMPNAVFHKDSSGIYRGCNKAFEEYTGIARDRVVGKTVFEIHPKEVAEVYYRKDNELFAHPGIQSYEAVIRHNSGIQRDIILTKAAYYDNSGRVAGLIGVMVDITERKRTEAILAYESSRFSAISEHAPFGMMMVDREGRLTYLNPKCREMFGYDQSDIPDGAAWFHAAFPESAYRRRAVAAWVGDLERTGTKEARSFTVTCKDGSQKIVSFILVHLESGGQIVSCEDITLRTQAEETLKESEKTLRALINATMESMFMTDPDGIILVANEVVAKRLGGSVESVVGTCQYDYFEPDVAVRRKRYYDMAVHTGQPVRFEDSRTGRHFESFCNPVCDSDGKVSRLAIFSHDVTQKKRAEEEKTRLESQLRQSQKMEAIGTLAGGVAHDFNNILTAIIGYGSLLQMHMERDDPKTVYVDQILASSQKAAVLTQSLLAFGRKQVMELKPHKINEIIAEAEKLLKRLLTEDIEFRVVLAEPGATIRADLTQIDQVLMNLATNARDSMPRGGRFTISTKMEHFNEEAAAALGLAGPGTYAVIGAADTGEGMDRKTREKIFEPFFTTKEVGKGTGLGLSIVYGIITQHNGHIVVESEPGHGSRFTVYLPAVEQKIERTFQRGEPVTGGGETVLVAEDNDGVRRLAREVLTRAGYTIIEAMDGDDAVCRFMEQTDTIDLLLLDVVMPKRNGKEAWEAIRPLRPDVKVLFMSGYTGDIIFTKGVRDEALNFIAKPLAPDELLRKVREVLDA